MSLLLDALKKAADEKKRSVDKTMDTPKPSTNHKLQDETETGDDEPVVDESLELELSLDTEQPESAQNNQQEFPLVDESTVNLTTENNSAPHDNSALIDNTAATDISTVADKEAVSTETDLPQEAEQVILEESIHEKKQIDLSSTDHSIDQLSKVTDTGLTHTGADVTEKPSEPVKPPADLTLQSTTREKHKYNKSIESEKALSALIDRSNQYNKKQNLRTKISLAILLFLILTGSALYFYIKINTTTQDLYISQGSTPVKNAIVNNKPEPDKQTLQNESQVANSSSTNPLTTEINQPASQLASAQLAKPVTAKTPTTNKTLSNKTAQVKQTQAINIVHTKKSDPLHKLLQDAYAAFNRADFQTAETLYQQVIQRESRNRDAILGLSAIAIKQQHYEYARQKYQYLLHLNPKDSIATAGISLINNSLNPQLSESQLKFMLKEQPDAAHLYFALGSLYSSQNQWAEAQSAFFSAWSTENKNADYAYNLAVSLDHLSKNLQALNYYQLSLKLAQSGNVNFSIENTQQRIRFLQQAQL